MSTHSQDHLLGFSLDDTSHCNGHIKNAIMKKYIPWYKNHLTRALNNSDRR